MYQQLSMIDSGIIYRNPKPHLWSKQAYFPSVADIGNGVLLCAVVIGEAFESADSRLYLLRSCDNGSTWEMQGRLLPEDDSRRYSESGRITALSDGSIAAIVFRYDRHRIDEGLANPETLGFVETECFISKSTDKGDHWTPLEKLELPLIGPSFELCSPIVELHDGRWLLPTSTWRAWDGYDPTGMKAVAFISGDKGNTWPEYVDVMDGSKSSVIYWEQKIAEMEPGRLVSVAWAYDEKAGKDLPNTYSISDDSGKAFSEPMDTGLFGQTPAILPLDNHRVLCVYRRMDSPGLWAAEASLKDGKWKTDKQTLLWGGSNNSMSGRSENMVSNFNVLRFGAPCITRLESGDILIAFWCVEDCVSNIRWIKLSCK